MSDRLYHHLEGVEAEFKQFEPYLSIQQIAEISVCLNRLWEIYRRIERDLSN